MTEEAHIWCTILRMKKKTVTKTASRKSTKQTTRKPRTAEQTVLIHRIFIVSACLTLFVGGVLIANKQQVTQSVAGASIMRGLFLEATVTVPTNIENAASYNIYYKETNEPEYTNAIRNVPTSTGSYIISHLKKGASYEYTFAAVDATGREFLFSEELPITDLRPM